MINRIKIENYKSIESLEFELGRVNVFVGENGCGKSNILEAIALYAAAASNKLDNEFLVSRGIRVTSDAKLMRSAFKEENVNKPISISIFGDNIDDSCILSDNKRSVYSKWVDFSTDRFFRFAATQSIERYLDRIEGYKLFEKENKGYKLIEKESILREMLQTEFIDFLTEMEILWRVYNKNRNKKLKATKFTEPLFEFFDKNKNKPPIELSVLLKKFIHDYLGQQNFIIYSPENTSLRVFETEGQILPLGIKGEGLLKLLQVLSNAEDKILLEEIKENLELISWFRDFHVPELFENKKSLQIQDKYIDEKIKYFDQVSSNEGFLFLLFYFCLFVSNETPSFFAIDNIDASLNPKLCAELSTRLVELAKKYQKQVIFTTHNPAILDGLNLDDPEQKLFVVYRNKMGYTKITPILSPKPLEGNEVINLSEAFLRGYIGGLPKNF